MGWLGAHINEKQDDMGSRPQKRELWIGLGWVALSAKLDHLQLTRGMTLEAIADFHDALRERNRYPLSRMTADIASRKPTHHARLNDKSDA
jgi:hypothetical protein